MTGSARLGRLLIVFFYLVVQDRLPQPLLYASPYFESRRSEYYERLQDLEGRGWLRRLARGPAGRVLWLATEIFDILREP